MSRLDLLSQTTPRPVDAQSRNASMTPDAQENSGGAATSDFGSFLEGFSGKAQKGVAAVPQQETNLPGAEADKANSELDKPDIDLLQALLPEVSPSDGSTVLQSGESAFSILESLLPRILPQIGNGGGADAERSGASPCIGLSLSAVAGYG